MDDEDSFWRMGLVALSIDEIRLLMSSIFLMFCVVKFDRGAVQVVVDNDTIIFVERYN